MRVPPEIVVNGVVLAPTIFTAKPQVKCRNPGEIQKRNIIRSIAQRADAQVRPVARLSPIIATPASNLYPARTLDNRNILLRIGHFGSHAVDEVFQSMRSLHKEIAASGAVGVEVHHRLLPQLIDMRLHPLRRSKQPRLLAIPRAVDDCPPRLPALLHEFAESPRLFKLS